ncbi:MAG: ABC transporter ATP-binding protein [Clostridia bacterium]|nr:ABC transporter ATP-binding protein [Clostridia bacterium]
MSFLDIRDLTVVYTNGRETVHALNDFSLRLERGKTLGLVGETGAGKTTAALSIMRLLPERTGRVLGGSVTFDGADLRSLKEEEMRVVRGGKISMIFQDPMTSLNPVLTVGEQIFETLELHNIENRSHQQLWERVDEMLALVGIPPERKKDYPHQFSGGMKQRVVIAIALACSPQLLIADEPTTALDVTIQAQVLAMMDELKQKLDMSMIMITHDLGIVAQTCDDVAVVYAGEIIESGSFEDFFMQDKRRHPYTRGLFGSIPNIDSRERRLTPIEGLMPDPTNLPEGCRFHPRCPDCTERCRTERPTAHERGGHVIRCHLFEKEGE